MKTSRTGHGDQWLCAGLAVAAFALATIGSGRSIPEVAQAKLTEGYLPESWEPDDDNGLDDSLRFLRDLTISPTDFIEASFPKHYIAIAYAVVFHRTGDALDAAYADAPARFVRTAYLTGFAISALFFAGAAVLTFLTARIEQSRAASAVAALAIVFNTALISHAHFAVFDLHLVFFVSLLLYLFVRKADPVWLAVTIGAAASTKYTGVLLFPLVPLADYLQSGSIPRLSRLLKHLVIAGAVFLALNPMCLIELPRFVHDLGVIYFTRHSFKGFEGGAPGVVTLLTNVAVSSSVLAPLMLLGFVSAASRKSRSRIEIAGICAALTYYMLSAWSRLDGMRFCLPLLPPLALLLAPLIDRMRAKGRALAPIVTVPLLVGGFAASIETVSLFYRDPRFEARRRLSACESVGVISRMSYVHPAAPAESATAFTLIGPKPRQSDLYYKLQRHYRRVLGREPPPPPPPPQDSGTDYYEANVTALESLEAGCLVLSSFDTARFFEQPGAFPATTRFLQDLLAERLGYRVVTRLRTRTHLVSHVDFLNPEIVILEKSGDAGPD